MIYSVIGEKALYCFIDKECRKVYVQGSLKFETIPELFWDHHEGVINVFIQNIQVAKILAISLSEITTLLYL